MTFDENNTELMEKVGKVVAQYAELCFPELFFNCKRSIDVAKSCDLDLVLALIDSTLGRHYTKHNGRRWKEEKIEELTEPGLVYVTYWHETQLLAFASVRMVLELEVKKLYLYEIHVGEKLQGRRFGSMLIDGVHQLAKVLNLADLGFLVDNKGTALTVFSDNEKAVKWYYKLGYTLSEDSPRDRTLRGRLVAPDFYILERPLS